MSDSETAQMDALLGGSQHNEETGNKPGSDEKPESTETPKDEDENPKGESEDETPKDEDENPKGEGENEDEDETPKEEDEDAKPLTVDEIKDLINKESEIPTGTDETLIELARTQLQLDVAVQERESLKANLKQDPAQLLTDEQRAEIEELNSTKGFTAARALADKYEKEALDKTLNNEELTAQALKIERQKELTSFLTENKVSFHNFKNAVLESNKKALADGTITFNEFCKRTHNVLKKISPETIQKKKDVPDIKKSGRQSKADGKAGKNDSEADLMKKLTDG